MQTYTVKQQLFTDKHKVNKTMLTQPQPVTLTLLRSNVMRLGFCCPTTSLWFECGIRCWMPFSFVPAKPAQMIASGSGKMEFICTTMCSAFHAYFTRKCIGSEGIIKCIVYAKNISFHLIYMLTASATYFHSCIRNSNSWVASVVVEFVCANEHVYEYKLCLTWWAYQGEDRRQVY